MSKKPALPPSATSNASTLVALATTSVALLVLMRFGITDVVFSLQVLFAAYALPIMVYEFFVLKVHLRASSGLEWNNPGPVNLHRIAVKLVGLAGVIGAVVLFHALFRLYEVPFVLLPLKAFLGMLDWVLPVSIAYVIIVDRRQIEPRDGLWHFGALLLFRNPNPDNARLKNFGVGWVVKGFFLPAMAGALMYRITTLDDIQMQFALGGVETVVALTSFMIVIDLVIAVVGYSLTIRLFDAHIRSSNSYVMGWLITLICYVPFNFVVFKMVFKYRTEQSWDTVIHNYPILIAPWCALVLVSYFIWLWATANFGIRFSNLTHRGIITGGPYRYSKHPDYVAKSCFFWLTAAPFLTALTTWEAITATASLFVINAVYYGRAYWEEKHLSEDPVYVEYALAMNQRSVFRPVARVLPFLIYKAPDGRTGLEDETLDGAHPAE